MFEKSRVNVFEILGEAFISVKAAGGIVSKVVRWCCPSKFGDRKCPRWWLRWISRKIKRVSAQRN